MAGGPYSTCQEWWPLAAPWSYSTQRVSQVSLRDGVAWAEALLACLLETALPCVTEERPCARPWQDSAPLTDRVFEKLVCETRPKIPPLPRKGQEQRREPRGLCWPGPFSPNHFYPQTDPPPHGGPQDGKLSVGMGRGVCALGRGASLGAATRCQLGPGGWDSKAQVRRRPGPQRPCAQPGLLGSRGKWPELEGPQVPGVGPLL